MPNTESAKRALRKMERRRSRNKSARSALRTVIKRVREAVASGNVEDAKSKLQRAVKMIDQASSKHLIHKNAGSRYKSRLTLLVSKTVPTTAK